LSTTTPLQRTLAYLKKQDIAAAKAEYWQSGWITHKIIEAAQQYVAMLADPTSNDFRKKNSREVLEGAVRMQGRGSPGVRKDLFGFVDIVALYPDGITAVQCTSGANVGSHVKKIKGIPEAWRWIQSGGFIEIWAWRKVKEGSKDRWRPRVIKIDREVLLNEDKVTKYKDAGPDAHSEDPF